MPERQPWSSFPASNGLEANVRYAAMLLCVLLVACGKAQAPGRSAGDTLTRRQRDSVLGASRLPGARGIRGALEAQDTAAAQNARADSIR
jgi:hypothetical protein